MLSDEEKREMLEDAADNGRRNDFRRMKELQRDHRLSLDQYIDFLMAYHNVFPQATDTRPMKTDRNIL